MSSALICRESRLGGLQLGGKGTPARRPGQLASTPGVAARKCIGHWVTPRGCKEMFFKACVQVPLGQVCDIHGVLALAVDGKLLFNLKFLYSNNY